MASNPIGETIASPGADGVNGDRGLAVDRDVRSVRAHRPMVAPEPFAIVDRPITTGGSGRPVGHAPQIAERGRRARPIARAGRRLSSGAD
jgi:hypothetical protein